MLARVRWEQGDALTLPIRWQVSIKVTPITAASGLPLTRGCSGRQLRAGGVTPAPGQPRLPGDRQAEGQRRVPLRMRLGTGILSPFPSFWVQRRLCGFFRVGALCHAGRQRCRLHGAARGVLL